MRKNQRRIGMAKSVFDLLIWFPAGFIAYIACLPIGFSPLFAAAATWFYLSRSREGWRDTIFAYGATAYVFIVMAVAVLRLPEILNLIRNSN
jgi:hypothetical protein